MHEMVERLDLSDLTEQQIAPLEAHFTPEWSDVWCDLARSLYLTLLSMPPRPPEEAAVLLTMGIAQDMGGTQPYIQAGTALLKNKRVQRVMDLIGQGHSYRAVAQACELTERSVRGIERSVRKARQQLASEEYRKAQVELDI